jgi:hypothetical protein
MVKKRCSQCRYWFAVPIVEADATSRCPDCSTFGSRLARMPGQGERNAGPGLPTAMAVPAGGADALT